MIKKFTVLLVLAIMFCALPITTNAESYNEEFYNEKETEIVSYDFYSEEDDKYYHLEKTESEIIVTDLSSNNIVSIAHFSEEINPNIVLSDIQKSKPISILAGPDDYESWGSFAFYSSKSLSIDWTYNVTMAVLKQTLKSWLAFEVLEIIVTKIWNDKYNDIYANIYYSYNQFCNILRKEKYEMYQKGTNKYIGTDNRGPIWIGNAYDYDKPYACRVLRERY